MSGEKGVFSSWKITATISFPVKEKIFFTDAFILIEFTVAYTHEA